MDNDLSKWIQLIIPILFSILTSLGIHKYLIEPRLIANQTRKKYATALWIACRELRIQLEKIKERVSKGDSETIKALKKIPNNDFGDRADWFTKVGYYTTITAYKIAVVSSWIRLYQRDLLFSTHTRSRTFISDLYEKADKIKVAFSTNTYLWFIISIL